MKDDDIRYEIVVLIEEYIKRNSPKDSDSFLWGLALTLCGEVDELSGRDAVCKMLMQLQNLYSSDRI